MTNRGRPNQDKKRVNITIDSYINEILDNKNINKSALITSLLCKFLILENNKSLVSSLSTLNSKKCRLRDLNSGPPDYESKEFKGLEFREESLNNFDLLSVYKINQNEFIEWLGSKYSQGYFNEVCSALDKIFNHNNSINNIKQFIYNNKILALRSATISLRVFFNYCEEYELLTIEQLNYFRNKIKIVRNKNMDIYNPTKEEIQQTLNHIIEHNPEYEFLYRFLLESGCRVTELENFLITHNKKNIEIWDDKIIIYSNFYIRGKKASYFVFITNKTYNKFKVNTLNKSNIEHLKNIIKYHNLLPLKYLRKYQFTLMIEQGVSLEIANFIQGRASQNVGFNHYLSKKLLAVREYQKIIFHFQQL